MKESMISLRLPNDINFIPIAIQFISDYARLLGFCDIALTQIEMSAEEGISNVIKHAFLASEYAYYDVHLQKDITGVTIRICDQGLPFDPISIQFNEETLEGLGSFVMSKMMDKIQYVNLGKAGKELILTKYFEEKQLEKSASAKDIETNIVQEHTYTFRPFQKEDAIEVARCAYESYGYTYAYEHIYYPERVKALNESEDLISVVAEAEDGTVCGHMALVKVEDYDSLYEIGLAMTKQQYRGGNIFAQLLGLIYEEIEKRKIHAVFGQCVTTHTYSQRNPVKIGMIPSALLPAYAPDDISFKNIAETDCKRTAVLIVNKVLIQTTKSEVYLPEKYLALSATIYNGLKADRKIITQVNFAAEEMSQAHLTVNTNLKMAKITFHAFGKDFDLILKNMIHQIKKENIAMAEAFVNISNKNAIQTINSAEKMGFRFSGILVGSPTGDIAILQFLNGILPNTEKIQVVEPAQHLLTFIEQQFD